MLQRKRLLRIDKHQATLSLLLLIGLTLPFTYVHEFGHVLVCWYSGVEIIKVSLGHTECAFNSENTLYYLFGGVSASMVALTPLAMKRIRHNKGLVVVLLTLSLYNVYNAGIETFNHGAYVGLVSGWDLKFGLSNALMFLGIYFGLFFRFLLFVKNQKIF